MKRNFVCFLVLFTLFSFGCTTAKSAPQIPVDPFSNSGSVKGLLVTLIKNADSGYIISTTGIEISDENKAIRNIFGIQELGKFLMVYSTKSDSFFLLPLPK
jgi:hypothetical protein